MAIQALSAYTDKQLLGLDADQLFKATCLEATLQNVQPPLEVFVIEPHNVAYLAKGDANKAAVNALRFVRETDGEFTADAPAVTVTSRFLRANDPIAFGAIRDAGLARFAAAQDAYSTRAQARANAILTAVGGNLATAQAVWIATETKAWPL